MTGRARRTGWEWIVPWACAFVAGCWYPTHIRMSREKAHTAAWDTLQRASQDTTPTVRWMAIEALAQTVGPHGGQVYVRGLDDPEPSVRAAAAMAVGDVGYTGARATLKNMAEDRKSRYWETDRRTYCAVIYALHRLGDDTHVEELGRLLWDRESQVRASAAAAMGKIGEPSAIGPLNMLQNDEQDPTVQIQIVESLAVLGDDRAERVLEAYSRRPFVDEQILAIQAMARARCHRARPVIRQLTGAEYPRVRVVAAGALGQLGEFRLGDYNFCIDCVRDPDGVLRWTLGAGYQKAQDHAESLRQLAAVALGRMGRTGAVDYLYPLLERDDGRVRVAAAMSILRLLPEQTARMRRHQPVGVRDRGWRIQR